MKVNKWLDIWLNKYSKNKIKLRTYLMYSDLIKNHIIPRLGDYYLNQLNNELIQDFINEKLEKGNLITHKGLSKNTIMSIYSILKQSIKYAFKLGIIKKNCIDMVVVPNDNEKNIDAFTIEEQKLIEYYCLNNKKNNYIGIILCLYTGIRIGELLALTWKDIDLKNKMININKTVCYIKINNILTTYISSPKTKKSNRIIPIPHQLIPYFQKIKKKSLYLICTKKGNMVTNRSYQKTFQSILKKLNITHRNFHSLRHTFATRALEYGMDVKTLSEILGHTNATITLNRYSHSMLQYKITMMNKLGKLLKNEITQNVFNK